MSIVAKVVVYGTANSVELSNIRDDGAFLGGNLVSVNGSVVDLTEMHRALRAYITAAEEESSGW